MRVFNQQIATATSMSANFFSAYVPLKNIFMYSIVAIVTGTPTGTLVLEASNDPETNDTVPLSDNPPIHWVPIASTSTSLSAAGLTMLRDQDVSYNYVRVSYTDGSSGSSTAVVNIVFNGKGY